MYMWTTQPSTKTKDRVSFNCILCTSKTHKRLKDHRFLTGQNKTMFEFSRKSSFSKLRRQQRRYVVFFFFFFAVVVFQNAGCQLCFRLLLLFLLFLILCSMYSADYHNSNRRMVTWSAAHWPVQLLIATSPAHVWSRDMIMNTSLAGHTVQHAELHAVVVVMSVCKPTRQRLARFPPSLSRVEVYTSTAQQSKQLKGENCLSSSNRLRSVQSLAGWPSDHRAHYNR